MATRTGPLRGVLVALLCLLLAGCGTYPKDPEKTLARIDRDHVLRVGVTHAPPLTDITAGTPHGREIDLVTGFAQTRGAQPQWTLGSEEQLVAQLEEGQLDVVVGALTKKTPWSSKAAVTRPWGKATDLVGKEQEYVFATPLGENALVVAIERFFDEQERR